MYRLNPEGVEKTDLIIGIPSYNEADTIGLVVEKSIEGVKKYFPDFRSVIINVDNNSPDDTRSAFFDAPDGVSKIYISTPPGVKGKGNNFYNLFNEMVRLNATACVVVDADLTSITAEWIRELASPILNGYDYASPLYSRNEYDGTITNNICYPLIYGLLGKDIRQPIGGDFSFSSSLGKYYLNQTWAKSTKQYGIDIFMTLHALLAGFECCQVRLGAKIHKPSAPKLGPMFSQVVGTLFQILTDRKDKWLGPMNLKGLPLFGEAQLSKPQSLSVDYKGMKETALYEFQINGDVLSNALPNELYDRYKQMYKDEKLNIGADLWMRTVYALLRAYDTTDLNSHLIEAMKSLYFGRVATFIKQTLEKDNEESEQMIQNQAKHFFRFRSILTQEYEYAEKAA
ncbi:glycosyltransferase [candidate division KSB1 bacterium]|nr:glycosyltransferase [candidate division KSB1 bacterium]NIR70086.1 glycosyltransferase [candidate division KSB1 bacterium]NIS27511.1 glycosyltransferase [candidate division KSB1 bacterium]NIT74360.1 glycosyltransferase [candidate division KSB1 bacterium]NIU28229.1 glycosyltransferase [candidate division KSB1 bacterium]